MAGETPLASGGTWTCPTCHRSYPDEFAVCPLDATPRRVSSEGSVASDPLIGEVLGKTFRVQKVLGQGGMARLYEAEHLRIDSHFAIKVIHDDLARDPALLARFEREARAAGKINSEHVVRLVDVLRTADGRPCLVTELLEGEDLQAMLDRVGKIGPNLAIPIARQICQAVAAAHAVGVVHRDLKPSNVFLCKSRDGIPMVKIFDFGVAKLDDDDKLTRTDAVMGTAAYMAPEQAKRAADAGPLADVYSIGAVVYHMLTGEPPYGNVPAVSRFALVLHEEPTRPRAIEPRIPEGIEAVIQHAMARERSARIATAMDLEAQLAMFDKRTTTQRVATTAKQPVVDPRTAEQSAERIALRAKVTRPVAGFVAVASSIAAGLWLAALLTALIEPTSGGERGLIALLGLAAIGAVGMLHMRALKPSWGSGPAISTHIAPYARALLGGITTYGALGLLDYGSAGVAHTEVFTAPGRLILSGTAAILGLGWRRWKLDDRLRKKIG
jgi:eukaryotic-like serine/threonine-protein kinase